MPPKVKFSFWLALHGQLWTADRRKHHGLQQEAACAMCDQHDETTDHLLCSCVFAREVWSRLLQLSGLGGVAPQTTSTLLDWWHLGRTAMPQCLKRCFDSLVILTSWCLWKERNWRTFDRVSRTTSLVVDFILDEASPWIGAGFSSLASVTAQTI